MTRGGAGLATPEFEDATLLKAVPWALSSASQGSPCLTVLVCPAWKKKEFHKLLSTQGGFSQLLASVPNKCLELRLSSNGPARLQVQRANDSIEFWVIANAAGHAAINKQTEKLPDVLKALNASCSRVAPKRGRPTPVAGEENIGRPARYAHHNSTQPTEAAASISRINGSVRKLATPTTDDSVDKGHKHRRSVFSGQWQRRAHQEQARSEQPLLPSPVWPNIKDLSQCKPAFDTNTVSVIFTDGSLVKGKPAGAGVHAMDGSQPDASFTFSGDQTVLRAELAAIQFAL